MVNETLPNLFSVFFPYARARADAVSTGKTRFVHYTSAESATKILKGKEVWLRKTSCMDDFMEVQHGRDCLVEAWRNKGGEKFKKNLDNIYPGISKKIADIFDKWIEHFISDTYISCFSEHDTEEGTLGRLSMWRAYGRSKGVALVLDNSSFLSASDSLKAYSSPVSYLSNSEFHNQLESIADTIEKNASAIKTHNEDVVIAVVLESLRFSVVCSKHPGFREEKEWRVIYCPIYKNSPHLKYDIEVINGIAQPIYKIPLKNISGDTLLNIEIPQLIERIIIGQTQYAMASFEAFTRLLEDAGVANAKQKVFVSNIPLR